MTHSITDQITAALGREDTANVQIAETGEGQLRSCFQVADLAVSSVRAAALELAALTGARQVALDRRLAQLWFDMTLRPKGWDLPSAWDAVAGDYPTSDGWIRLHTNAPHHRAAAMSVLGAAPDRAQVAEAVADWEADNLETAIVGAGGVAAAMRGLSDWASHPQGQAVAAQPLIRWTHTGDGPKPDRQGLEACRVLDLTRVLAGPIATRFLAGFGADVLRIDPPTWDEPGVVPEVTIGKRRAGLDLRRAEDRQVFEALLAKADVLVHGYRPGALDGLGYDAGTRQRLRPGLIDVCLNAYGWDGPWAGRRGFDSLVQMSSGIAAEGMKRARADRPAPLPVQALDHATGYLIAAAVLRALRLRARSGAGWSAHLSLARTATLLTSAGAGDFTGGDLRERGEDLAPDVEQTAWGPARRLRFPVTLEGKGPDWRVPAGHLRVDPAQWAQLP
ncbi:CoA transferase [Arenibacterium halophilum]|uniref:Acyl-CoA transferase n=1 Tax=Arenibacterium halophilum TaxID=2583821 RepID=A0ABY2XE34_9RHOB|nr:CoA transferase [Arenibacterium halophilum]TMV14625.1 acyl-CoA transferase [Arenibacterium halophilum]